MTLGWSKLSKYPCDKSGLRSPDLPDELIIKWATKLSVSVTIKATFILNLCGDGVTYTERILNY